MDRKTVIKEIKSFIRSLSKEITIKEVILFGSRARGDEEDESDIDLMIISDDFEGVGYFKRMYIMYRYWKARIPIDFMCYTSKEFNALKQRVSIVSVALQEGISIK